MLGKHTNERQLVMADTVKERIGSLLILRAPWLILGLVGGLLTSIVVSGFEKTIEENIALTFFLPVIVYMSDAVGTQTEAVFVRRLSISGKVHFGKYLIKEAAIGLIVGAVLALILGGFTFFWVQSPLVALVVAIAMVINVTLAPIMAMLIPELMFKEHVDPAVGSGPFTTIIQDLVSVLVYLLVAGIILG